MFAVWLRSTGLSISCWMGNRRKWISFFRYSFNSFLMFYTIQFTHHSNPSIRFVSNTAKQDSNIHGTGPLCASMSTYGLLCQFKQQNNTNNLDGSATIKVNFIRCAMHAIKKVSRTYSSLVHVDFLLIWSQ